MTMITRREALQVTALGVGALATGPALAFAGAAHRLVVEPRGEIHADAAVWLVSGSHRMCVWSASRGPIPSVAPGVEHAAARGMVEVRVGDRIERAPLSRLRSGRLVRLPGDDAALWIGTSTVTIPVG